MQEAGIKIYSQKLNHKIFPSIQDIMAKDELVESMELPDFVTHKRKYFPIGSKSMIISQGLKECGSVFLLRLIVGGMVVLITLQGISYCLRTEENT